MSWNEIGLSINIGGRFGNIAYQQDQQQAGLDMEARRLAYMLNTGDPYAEHEGAMQLSQDLNGTPLWAQKDLIQRTQMYEDPNMGAKLVVQPVLQQTGSGALFDTGNRDVRVVDSNFGINDEVTYMNGTNNGFYRPGANIDLFLGVNGCSFGNNMPWMSAEWQNHSWQERNYWREQGSWQTYDGRGAGHAGFVRPSVGAEFDTRINNFSQTSSVVNNFYNNTSVRNYYNTHVTSPGPIGRPLSSGAVRLPFVPGSGTIEQHPTAVPAAEPRAVAPLVPLRTAIPQNVEHSHVAPVQVVPQLPHVEHVAPPPHVEQQKKKN